MIDFTQFPSPCYIMEEELLRKNLSLIKSVADRAGVGDYSCFQTSFFPLCGALFPIFREYIDHSTASSHFFGNNIKLYLGYIIDGNILGEVAELVDALL